MPEIKQTQRAARTLNDAVDCCKSFRHEFVMPEHLLLALTDDNNFYSALEMFLDPHELVVKIESYLDEIEPIHTVIKPDGNVSEYEPELSLQMSQVLQHAMTCAINSGVDSIDTPHLAKGILQLEESWAAFHLRNCLENTESDFLSQLISLCELDDEIHEISKGKTASATWKKLVTCMNDLYKNHNPLIGREQELTRTIQVLCRCDKNNPLHIGEPGVGKTALVWGLVQRIVEGNVPSRLKDSRVYQIDLGTLLAGTQYRGDFENRIKQIMEGIMQEGGNNIVYIDEIHTLVGAGAIGDSSMDASNMLKPYLESGTIRFIGSTTYEEYNKHFSRSKGLVRRFQQIDIAEPSVTETVNIIKQLKSRFEEFHGVTYTDEAILFAVESSAKHINDRCLPDKAIDLIDEAGAAVEVEQKVVEIGKKEIAEVLSRICKVDALAIAEEHDYKQLENLAQQMLAQIYGQDEAIIQVVEAVQMARAGLLDDNKPLASLLFVGPTGVGKTEVARVLAKQLGIEMVRFDMSEFAEKHSVAKLIGSPAGYIGYDDGGLLTDAIRKSPNCVLLLDEIEKAHQDIYNILLQVMDYARLTDNKGRHADFRNVILIMTSNAGAQFASQGTIGFNSSVSRGDAMMKQVKKTFKPEFLNRLSGAVVFHDMNREMASLILQKKLHELDAKLAVKSVKMTLSQAAFDYLLRKGFTAEYGAREIDRIISKKLKPLLMHEILFGSLRNGGAINVDLNNGCLSIR